MVDGELNAGEAYSMKSRGSLQTSPAGDPMVAMMASDLESAPPTGQSRYQDSPKTGRYQDSPKFSPTGSIGSTAVMGANSATGGGGSSSRWTPSTKRFSLKSVKSVGATSPTQGGVQNTPSAISATPKLSKNAQKEGGLVDSEDLW